MAIAPTYPGVYIEELPSPVHTVVGVATSITAFIGYTARGIDNRAERILSFSDYERLFGGLAADSELSYAVQQFFSNGGSQGYVVRVPKTGAAGAQVQFSNLTFTALSSGTWADNNILIDVWMTGRSRRSRRCRSTARTATMCWRFSTTSTTARSSSTCRPRGRCPRRRR
jgi:phage tail sheath protein FI